MASVLLVDDDRELLESLEVRLRRKGHTCAVANGANEARIIAETKFFDVVLSDHHMPGRTGLDLLSELKEIQPGCARILMSGRLDLPVVMEAVNRGEIHRVVEKPFEMEQLQTLIAEALEQRQRLKHLHSALEQQDSKEEMSELQDCLQGGVKLAIQPIVDAMNLKTFAYEALIRSEHAVLKGPDELIGTAERLGMIGAVADVVAGEAQRWLVQLPAPLNLFVNLHPQELADPDLLADRLCVLEPYAQRTVLEITERSRVMDFGAWRESTQQIRDRGFRIAVDDLGAGFSSLSVLAELLPDFIKVDMSIIKGIDQDQHKKRLVALLCRFAAGTDAQLVAEGVETEAEAETVKECGAHLLQGYLFGKPAFAPTFIRSAA